MKKTVTTETATTLFPNLYAAIKAEQEENFNRFAAELEKETDPFEIINKWVYADLMTAAKKRFVWELSDLKKYLAERKRKAINKTLASKLQHLLTVEQAADFKGADISIEWKKNRTWGSNPTAEARIHTTDRFEYFNSGSIGGCGYDKRSTAAANALNQSNSFLKAMYLLKEQNPTARNGDLFGYGSGYGILPRLEGGVGVSCYPEIFAKIGFKWVSVAEGRTFDVYSIQSILNAKCKVNNEPGEFTGYSPVTKKYHVSLYNGKTAQLERLYDINF